MARALGGVPGDAPVLQDVWHASEGPARCAIVTSVLTSVPAAVAEGEASRNERAGKRERVEGSSAAIAAANHVHTWPSKLRPSRALAGGPPMPERRPRDGSGRSG